jgi:hypothetical protein
VRQSKVKHRPQEGGQHSNTEAGSVLGHERAPLPGATVSHATAARGEYVTRQPKGQGGNMFRDVPRGPARPSAGERRLPTTGELPSVKAARKTKKLFFSRPSGQP